VIWKKFFLGNHSTADKERRYNMSKEKQREILENLDKLPEDKKQFVFGYMEGICQMSEKQKKEATKDEE
jgi:hypothetical protein